MSRPLTLYGGMEEVGEGMGLVALKIWEMLH